MKVSALKIRITLVTFIVTSIITNTYSDEVGEGAFWGATSGAIIGGAASGGRGAGIGIGAGVGLGLGLIGGSAARSRRQRREEQAYQRYRSLRNEEYAHEELFAGTPGDIDEDDDNEYVTTQIEKKPKKYSSKENSATVDIASEDEEYKDEEVMPDRTIEVSYEDEK